MSGGFSERFIRRPVATTLLMLALLLVGLVAYPLLPVAPLPQIDFPTITVSAQLTDATGNPLNVFGQVVTWSKTGAGGSFASATTTTNNIGIATVSFTTGTIAGATYTFTATDASAHSGQMRQIAVGPQREMIACDWQPVEEFARERRLPIETDQSVVVC